MKRGISMILGKLIGRGRTAEVFELDNNKIVKLYYKHVNESIINQEYNANLALKHTSLPAPKVIEKAEVVKRKGIVFEKATGESLLNLIIKRPYRVKHYAKLMARIHYQIHQITASNIMDEKGMFEYAINKLKDRLTNQNKLLRLLTSLPKGNKVCHGDLHPDNILLTKKKKMVAIDWMNCYIGNPLSDVARNYILINSPYINENTPKIIALFSKLLKKKLWKSYLKEYCKLAKIDEKLFEPYLPLVAVNRLLEQIPNEEEWLFNIINTCA